MPPSKQTQSDDADTKAMETMEVVVAPGRTVMHSETLRAQETNRFPNGEKVVVPPVVQERHYRSGQTITLPVDEALHLIAAGFVTHPDAEPVVMTAGPRLIDETTGNRTPPNVIRSELP